MTAIGPHARPRSMESAQAAASGPRVKRRERFSIERLVRGRRIRHCLHATNHCRHSAKSDHGRRFTPENLFIAFLISRFIYATCGRCFCELFLNQPQFSVTIAVSGPSLIRPSIDPTLTRFAPALRVTFPTRPVAGPEVGNRFCAFRYWHAVDRGYLSGGPSAWGLNTNWP